MSVVVAGGRFTADPETALETNTAGAQTNVSFARLTSGGMIAT